MGSISTILAAIMCATAPLASAEVSESKTEQTQPTFKLGKKTVSSVREAYEKGEYTDFLRGMDAAYNEADLDGLKQMRQNQIPADFHEKWEQRFTDLQKEKNTDLLSVLSDKDDSIFAQQVRSVAGTIYTPEQEQAMLRLGSFIAMAPNSGANADENKLIDIDFEYEYKILHASMPSEDTSPDQRNDQRMALRMEKMDRMVEASKSFQDHSLKQAVQLSAAGFDASLARNLDGSALNALVKGKVKPSNELEEKIFSILSSYQGQFSDLMKELGDSN